MLKHNYVICFKEDVHFCMGIWSPCNGKEDRDLRLLTGSFHLSVELTVFIKFLKN